MSTFDLVLITRHILNVTPFSNPYQIIAADANNDKKVTTIDLVELRKLVLGISLDLPNNQSWRFIDLAETVNNDFDPFAFNESIQLENLTQDVTNINFIGVKVGDVSGAATNNLFSSESRSSNTLAFTVQDVLLQAGEVIEIPVTSENFEQIIGYQFTMNTTGLDIIDVKAGALKNLDKSNFAKLDAQTMTTVWSNSEAVSTNETLFTLVVEALENTPLSEALTFNANATPALAYEASAKSMDIDLVFQSLEVTTPINQIKLLQNEPNPFVHETTIGFELANEEAILLQVFDATGRTVFVQNGNYDKGSHRIKLSNLTGLPNGILYYQLTTANFQVTKKMIRQR